jgi:hypothetical protein
LHELLRQRREADDEDEILANKIITPATVMHTEVCTLRDVTWGWRDHRRGSMKLARQMGAPLVLQRIWTCLAKMSGWVASSLYSRQQPSCGAMQMMLKLYFCPARIAWWNKRLFVSPIALDLALSIRPAFVPKSESQMPRPQSPTPHPLPPLTRHKRPPRRSWASGTSGYLFLFGFFGFVVESFGTLVAV